MNTVNIAELDFTAYVRSTAEGTPKPLVVLGFLSTAYNVALNQVSLVGNTGTFKVKGLDHACQLTSTIISYLAPARQAYPVKKAAQAPKQVQQAAQKAAHAVVKAAPQAASPEPHLFDFLVGEAARVMDSTQEAILEALAPQEPALGDILQEQKDEKKVVMNKRKTLNTVLS